MSTPLQPLAPKRYPTTTACVPPDARLFSPAVERPLTVAYGLQQPSVATYADGRTVVAEHERELGLLTGLDWRSFWHWQQVGEDDEEFRQRSLSMMNYRHAGARWEVRLDWGRAYIFRDRAQLGTALVAPVGQGRVRVTKYAGQPRHTLPILRWLAARVAGVPDPDSEVVEVADPRDDWDYERGQTFEDLRRIGAR